MHKGVDDRLISMAEPYSGQPPTILVLGRLEAYKNVGRVLAAFATLERPAQMVIIGDGIERQRRQAKAIPFGDDVKGLRPN